MRPEAFLSYDGAEIARDALRFADDGRSVAFEVEATPGIHTIAASDRATDRDGRRLLGGFRSRFRSGDEGNPIITLVPGFLEDRSLVSSEPPINGKRRLSFRQVKTQWLRISSDRRTRDFHKL